MRNTLGDFLGLRLVSDGGGKYWASLLREKIYMFVLNEHNQERKLGKVECRDGYCARYVFSGREVRKI